MGNGAILTAIVSKTAFEEQFAKLVSPSVSNFLNSSSLLILIGMYLYVVLLQALYSAIEHYSKPEKELLLKDVLSILQAINVVVADKNRRFGGIVKAYSGRTSLDPSETFIGITRPDQQLILLINSIRSVFQLFLDDKNTSFRVGLIRVINGKPHEWAAYAPDASPPRTEAVDLAVPSSTVSCAISAKSIVVVQDIQKELKKKTKHTRKFVKGNTQDKDQGSQLCYPIFYGKAGNIEYVLTISGDKKDCLLESHAELYTWILEHNLLILRDKST